MRKYDALDTILILTLIAIHHPEPKRRQKKAMVLIDKVTDTVRMGLLTDIITGKSYLQVLKTHSERFVALNKAADEIYRSHDGVGMVIVKGQDQAFPVKLSYEEEEDKPWSLENEHIVALASAHSCMNELGLKRLACDVVLFKNQGFSGIKHPLDIIPDVKSQYSQSIGDSQYFF